jgi:flagellin-like protein
MNSSQKIYMFASKKGVSPLIATVLLIAFAVSLGAVIMNLGMNLTSPCETVKVEAFVVASEQKICYNPQTKMIETTITNAGTRIDGYRISAVGDIVSEKDVIGTLEELARSVHQLPYTGVRVDAVSFIPIITHNGELTMCRESEKVYANIRPC